MSEQDRIAAALGQAGIADVFTLQISALTLAVRALIATHPDPAAVRRVFDQLFGQVQTGPAALESSIEARLLAKYFAEGLFS